METKINKKDKAKPSKRVLRRHLRRYARHLDFKGAKANLKLHSKNGVNLLKLYVRGILRI